MKIIYLSIGVKKASLTEVNSALTIVGVNNFIPGKNDFIEIEVMDLRDEYLTTSSYLKENNLLDETPFFNDFDINPYGMRVDVNINKKYEYVDILEFVVFILGQKLSFILKTECIVMFDNNTIPIALFDCGLLIQTFEEYNSQYLLEKRWRPFF
jgi:hypothetical protein